MTEAREGVSRERRVLVYYFAFPHYQREILEALLATPLATTELVSGSATRASVAGLDATSLPGLSVKPSVTIGPFSWDRGVALRAISARFDAVVLGPAHSSLTTWVILLVRALLGRRTFLWGQCGLLGDRSIRRWVQEVMNRLATGLLVYGEAAAEAARSLGTSARKVTIVNNASSSNRRYDNQQTGVQSHERAVAAVKHARETGELVLTFIGRLTPDKRLDVLFDALARLRDNYPSVTLHVVGDGPDRAALASHPASEHAQFHGWIYDSEKLEHLLKQTTMVVSPYLMGLLALDALRAGVPVLVPDNPLNGPEVEALTEGVNSLRFEAGNAASLAETAGRWVEDVHSSVSLDVFMAERTRALRRWEPAMVAERMMKAVVDRAD